MAAHTQNCPEHPLTPFVLLEVEALEWWCPDVGSPGRSSPKLFTLKVRFCSKMPIARAEAALLVLARGNPECQMEKHHLPKARRDGGGWWLTLGAGRGNGGCD